MYKTWLEIRFVERELFHKKPSEASIENIKDILEDE